MQFLVHLSHSLPSTCAVCCPHFALFSGSSRKPGRHPHGTGSPRRQTPRYQHTTSHNFSSPFLSLTKKKIPGSPDSGYTTFSLPTITSPHYYGMDAHPPQISAIPAAHQATHLTVHVEGFSLAMIGWMGSSGVWCHYNMGMLVVFGAVG